MALVFPFLLSFLRLVSTSPILQQATHDTSACSHIQSSLTPLATPDPTGTVLGTVPAELAWDCLWSIPINATGALDLVNSIRPYIKFQSTIAWLKNPPEEYSQNLFGPVDLLGGLDAIAHKIQDDEYGGEYEFGFELYKLFQSAHDGHLYFVPDVVNSLFQWYRPMPIVSVSNSDDELPGIFAYGDIILAGTDSSFKPSAIEEINDTDVLQYLDTLSQIGSLQDRDALWNTVFYSLPQIALGSEGLGTGVFSGGGRGRIEYPGASTTVKFANGSTVVLNNLARVTKDFAGITSGEDVYNKYFLVKDDMSIDLQNGQNLLNDPRFAKSKSANATDKQVVAPPGFPVPIVRMSTNEVAGYYLDGEGYSDVAVLALYSFISGNGQQEFQDVTRGFLTQAQADGKKKLILDVSANGGGTIWLGYELFAQLFPAIVPWGGNRFRAHQAWDEMGRFDSVVSANITRSMTGDPANWDWVAEPMNYRSDLDAFGNHFISWKEKYGPHPANDDFHTTVQRWDLDDPFAEYYSGLTALTGHGLPTLNLTFKAEDIVIMYDGYCASTCTIFSEFMRQQAGVETIAMGGRVNDNLIQAVGGTKGSNNWAWSDVLYFVLAMHDKAPAWVKKSWVGTELEEFNTFLPFKRVIANPELNLRDAVRPNGDPTPLQFIYEPADCRLYYTPEMTVSATKLWEAVADTKWFGKRSCIAGGLKNAPGSYPGSRDKSQTMSMERKGSKEKKSSKSANVPLLRGEHISALQDSFDVFTDFQRSVKANGMMLPY
jgi:hypothetical protein